MAPLRRYLRITKHSVLEVRIYLDRPADGDGWLLNPRDPVLPRVIQAIRPLVLPKLREENERGRGKGSAKAKKKGVKDVVMEDDFEVSIFLTELSSRHSVLTKQKLLKDKARIQSNSGKLTKWLGTSTSTGTGTSQQPVVVLDEDAAESVVIREEEDDDEVIPLADIPEADVHPRQARQARRSARQPCTTSPPRTRSVSRASDGSDWEVDEGEMRRLPNVTSQDKAVPPPEDDKKKFSLRTSYEGFSIYGRILCLVVKRRGVRSQAGRAVAESSQAMMENWVSTQAAAEQPEGDDE